MILKGGDFLSIIFFLLGGKGGTWALGALGTLDLFVRNAEEIKF